jgi:hypothetical protein
MDNEMDQTTYNSSRTFIAIIKKDIFAHKDIFFILVIYF